MVIPQFSKVKLFHVDHYDCGAGSGWLCLGKIFFKATYLHSLHFFLVTNLILISTLVICVIV